MSAPNPRVAPTTKISDDARFPVPAGHPVGPSSIPPQSSLAPSMPPPRETPQAPYQYVPGPVSIAPQNHGSFAQQPHSIPPQNNHYPHYPPSPGSMPPQNNGAPGPSSIPPHNAYSGPIPQLHPQMPSGPHATGPLQPRTSGSRPPVQTSARAKRISSPSLGESEPAVPQRRWGLIITVLMFDLALAGAGVYLLSEGLS